MKKEITFQEVKNEVINRQKYFGTKRDPDICINKTFNGLTLKNMITLLNNWPKCECSETHLKMKIKYDRPEEITFHLLRLATFMED